ncbi:MAG: caspase family protein, partial [Gammaproteobacteria bacterium]|nr:caspase family protein [Gammaproteobacteria bacterium]
MTKKLALLIGNDKYNDGSLGNLVAPQADVAALAAVLKGKGYAFEVETLHNPELAEARQKVFDLFDDRDKDDTVLLYFSGHGVLGSGRTRPLYLALQQTDYDRPGRDSLSASDIKREMENSFALRQIILLDCCHSGAFSAADKGGEALTEESFSVRGVGKALLASSTRLQASQDGSKTGLQHSLFTH